MDTKEKVYLYIPETFNALDFFDNQRWADSANWFMDRLYLYSHFGMREDKFGFTPLKSKYLRMVIPKTFEKYIRQTLIEKGVVECDFHYIKGQKSYGYKLTELYRVKHKRIEVKDNILIKNILKARAGGLKKLSKVHEHLFKQFKKLTISRDNIEINDPKRKEWKEFNQLAIEQLKNHDWTPVVCDYGRFHSPLSRLMTEWRDNIFLNNQKTITLDICNSQPLFLALLIINISNKQEYNSLNNKELYNIISNSSSSKEYNIIYSAYTVPLLKDDVKRYIELCQQGILYEFLGQNSDIPRMEFKKSLFKDVFFGKNCVRSPLVNEFEKLFPTVMGFIRKIKETNYRRLAWVLQKEESKLMIDTICGRLMNEHPDLAVATVHDSLMIEPQNEETVKKVILEEFEKVGLIPTIKITNCNNEKIMTLSDKIIQYTSLKSSQWDRFMGNNHEELGVSDEIWGGSFNPADHIGKPLSETLWHELVLVLGYRQFRIYKPNDLCWCDAPIGLVYINLDDKDNIINFRMTRTEPKPF